MGELGGTEPGPVGLQGTSQPRLIPDPWMQVTEQSGPA